MYEKPAAVYNLRAYVCTCNIKNSHTTGRDIDLQLLQTTTTFIKF